MLLIFSSALLSSGCVTTEQVEAIVAESNSAMVEPYYQKPDDPGDTNGVGAVEKIDSLIAAHPDNKVLVNHLRVRQAMILTIQGKENLANQRWGMVEAGELKNEREVAFYQSREALVFAYSKLEDHSALATNEQKAIARAHRKTIEDATGNVKTRDIVIYLQMIRAMTGLKLANAMDEEQEPQAVTGLLASSLNEFAATFTNQDREWVKDNLNKANMTDEMTIQDLRQRVWLRDLAKAFWSEADSKELHPAWSPEVGVMMQ